MDKAIDKYKGISPAAVLQRALKKQKLNQVTLAVMLSVQPQTINAIIKGHRKLTTDIALKIDNALGLEDGTMSVLQALYETKKIKQQNSLGAHPDLTKLRDLLFWDTDLKKIDWQNQSKAVINRVMERGNEQEKQEIIRFYGLA
jgi:addiction module HigA family antidote